MDQAKTVFIIEDDIFYADTLKMVLMNNGYIVKVFNDPIFVMEAIRNEKPDLIILDIMLPKISGFSILEQIKKDTQVRDVPVFCLTNLPEEVGREKALSLEAYCYLTKARLLANDIVQQIDFYFKEAPTKSPPPPA